MTSFNPQLALSIQSNKGVYALLLGSGVSRSAGILSGWDVMTDLIVRLAHTDKETITADRAEVWYKAKFGETPGYSSVMEHLFKTSSERQGAIRGYFEPTDTEREENPDAKRPTAAHRAIARLMKHGFIRVVVTTNFDRLLEQALDAEGIQPTVISSEDDAKGAVPLIHSPCTIIKVNGDYLDTRQLHTSDELSDGYPETLAKLLDQIFDEFGLIVSGWSGDYDVSLYNAIVRAPNRRYPMAWTQVGQPTQRAEELVRKRDGRFVPISGADSFFTNLEDALQSLEYLRMVDSNSEDLLVAKLKRLLPNLEDTIRIRDLVQSVTDSVVFKLKELHLAHGNAPREIEPDELKAYLDWLTVIIGPLTAMAVVTGRWWRNDQLDLWQSVLSQVWIEARWEVWRSPWEQYHQIPAMMVYYALSAGMVIASRIKEWAVWLDTDLEVDPQSRVSSILVLHPDRLDFSSSLKKAFTPYESKRRPLAYWVNDHLMSRMKKIEGDQGRLYRAYAKMEILMAFRHSNRYFAHNNLNLDYQQPIPMILGVYSHQETMISDTINELKKASQPFLNSGDLKSWGFCTGSESRFDKDLSAFKTQVAFRDRR